MFNLFGVWCSTEYHNIFSIIMHGLLNACIHVMLHWNSFNALKYSKMPHASSGHLLKETQRKIWKQSPSSCWLPFEIISLQYSSQYIFFSISSSFQCFPLFNIFQGTFSIFSNRPFLPKIIRLCLITPLSWLIIIQVRGPQPQPQAMACLKLGHGRNGQAYTCVCESYTRANRPRYCSHKWSCVC